MIFSFFQVHDVIKCFLSRLNPTIHILFVYIRVFVAKETIVCD